MATQKLNRPQGFVQWFLVGLGLALVALLLAIPLALIFTKAFSGGLELLAANLTERYMVHATLLTLFVAAITVPVNVLFGIMLAWCVTQYDFRGRKILLTVIDIPYAVSPVVAGLCYLVMYGVESLIGGFIYERGWQIMFAWPGIVMVTIFVTAPYVARILIPVMQQQGRDEEYAALTLGANGWQIFWHVTFPKMKWGLIYGVVVTNARAVGEFGAVAVVSGTIIGQTLTLSLLVEQLNNDYKPAAAFTAAGLLASMAIVTLALKTVVEWRQARLMKASVENQA